MRDARAKDAPMDSVDTRRFGGAALLRAARRAGRLALAGATAASLFAAGAAAQGAGEPEIMEDATIAFDEIPTSELMDLFMDVGLVLKKRQLLPEDWNPAQDYAEILVRKALKLSKGSSSGLAQGAGGVRFRIVGEREPQDGPPAPVAGLKPSEFDRLVVVLFEKRFAVDRAVVMPSELVASKAPGGELALTPANLRGAGVEDVTVKIDRLVGDDFR